MSYDARCYELAQDFLDDVQPGGVPPTAKDYDTLAEYIQSAVEAWLREREQKAEP